MSIEIRNAVIERAVIESGDMGFLDAWLTLNYGNGGAQGFGGYALYLPKHFRNHTLESPAGHFIFRVMEIAGVTDWSRLAGKAIRARVEDGLITAIGHIVNDDWFCPQDDSASLQKAKEATKEAQ